MIITRTPFRVSFVGGGSDFADFYLHNQGAVLSTTIDKYMYISSHGFFDSGKIRAKYSRTETVADVNELKHPIMREVLKKFEIRGAIEISSNADVPAGSGLGSSSAFTVGLLHNLYAREGRFVTAVKLAEEACHIEIDVLKAPIGVQDQYAAAFGGLNIITFNTNGTICVDPIFLQKSIYQELQENLLMFYTGKQRSASRILAEQKFNIQAADKVAILKKMVSLVWRMRDALYAGDLPAFGGILEENWLLKRELASGVSSKEIDDIYDCARRAGATGGKLLGAGGDGFLLLYCEKARQESLRNALHALKEMQFKFDSEGAKVIYAAY